MRSSALPAGGRRSSSSSSLSFLSLCLLLSSISASAQTHNGIDNINGTLVKCHTTALDGAPFILEIKKEWAPLGAERFLQLVETGFFSQVPFFRVVKGFLVQFGIPPPSAVRKHWREAGPIKDDPTQHRQILRGYLSFAGSGPDSRDSSLFIANADSDWLGKAEWEVPLGRVIEGMEVIDALNDEYGEIHPFNKDGIAQGKIWDDVDYLKREFPNIDSIMDCAIIEASVKKEEDETEDKAEVAAVGKEEAAKAAAAHEEDEEETTTSRKPPVVTRRKQGAPDANAIPPRVHGLWAFISVLGLLTTFSILLYSLNDQKTEGKGT